MARIRSIHPDACDSATLADLSDSAERTFWRLLTHTDDEGRGDDHPKLLAAKLYPLIDRKNATAVDKDLDELQQAGLLVRYEVDGRRCYALPGFGEWQKPRHPLKSKLPGPPTADRRNATADRGSPTAGGVIGVGGGVGEQHHAQQAALDEEFTRFWDTYPARNGKKVGKAKAAMLFSRLTVEQRQRAVTGAANLARSDQLPKDPERFLRRDTAGAFPFDDWQEAAVVRSSAVRPLPPVYEPPEPVSVVPPDPEVAAQIRALFRPVNDSEEEAS